MSEPVQPAELRVGAAEREAAVAALGEHLAAGRLDPDEYHDRASAAALARTRADLRALFHDLPDPFGPLLPPGTGPGWLPAELRAELAAEGILVLDEDLPGSMTYRRRQGIARRAFRVRGTVAVSRRRLVIWAAGGKRVDLPYAHPLWQTVRVSANRPGQLRVRIDNGVARSGGGGVIELRFQTSRASTVADLLAS